MSRHFESPFMTNTPTSQAMSGTLAAPAAGGFWHIFGRQIGQQAAGRYIAKRVQFNSPLLPYLFLAPQMAIIFIFFYWPSVQAIQSSFYLEDPFGFGSTFVGIANYTDVLKSSASIWASPASPRSSPLSSPSSRCRSACCSPSRPMA